MRGTLDFKLVLCADVWGLLADYAVRELKFFLEAPWVEGGSAGVSSRPSVTYTPRPFYHATGELSFAGAGHRRLWAWAPLSIKKPTTYYRKF